MTVAPIRWTRTVDVSPEEAFGVFAERLGEWWPREYTWSGEMLETIAIEPGEGGRCYELGPHGFHCDWGRVLVWAPGERLVLAWQISPRREPEPNPAKASEIEVRFTPIGAGRTQVEFEHRGLDRHGDGGEEYRAALASDAGWPWILARFAERCS